MKSLLLDVSLAILGGIVYGALIWRFGYRRGIEIL